MEWGIEGENRPAFATGNKDDPEESIKVTDGIRDGSTVLFDEDHTGGAQRVCQGVSYPIAFSICSR